MKAIKPLKPNHLYLMSSGDLRLSANQKCWPEQAKMEAVLGHALEGRRLDGGPRSSVRQGKAARLHRLAKDGHGSLSPAGSRLRRSSSPSAVWQYSHHVLHGLFTHRGPILTVANWSGTWPGLVGMLNLNGSLTKAGIRIQHAVERGFHRHLLSRPACANGSPKASSPTTKATSAICGCVKLPAGDEQIGRRVAREFKQQKAIMGVFDEGCMGMFNAIIPDELLHPTGVFKERLSQSTLYAAMQRVTDAEARTVLDWLLKKGMTFRWGRNEETELTESQTLAAMQNVHRRRAPRG